MRCFMVPRGSTILAGGMAHATDRTFSMQAELGSQTYGILSNTYLDQKAKTVLYQCTITVGDDGSLAYDQTTTIDHAHLEEPLLHIDRNVLHKVG